MLETPARIEPCFFEEHIPTELADLSVDIQREATGLGLGLHPDSAAELADLVRVMNCYYSNLLAHDVTSPVWTAISGMTQFVDDPLGINSSNAGLTGSDIFPYTSGYLGYGMRVANIGRRAYFDHIVPARQL